MVALSTVLASNSLIRTTFPPRLIALFVGATSGIGETTLKRFAERCKEPRAYFVGRSREAGERIVAECKEINPEGEYVFIEKDISLVRNVDEVCEMITAREESLNILFLSAGLPIFDRRKTSENLHLLTALSYYTRLRFTTLLLPLLTRSPANTPRRIIHVAGGQREGPLTPSDLPALRVPLLRIRGHLCTLITLGLEAASKTPAAQGSGVAFVHVFPGQVDTALPSRMSGVLGVVMRAVVAVVGRWTEVPVPECGERMLFLATSARFPGVGVDGSGSVGVSGMGLKDGIILSDGVHVAVDTEGVVGGGVYSVGWDGEGEWSTGTRKMMESLRESGVRDEVWKHTESEFRRIIGEGQGEA